MLYVIPETLRESTVLFFIYYDCHTLSACTVSHAVGNVACTIFFRTAQYETGLTAD
jgi:hypothetical protein